MSTNSDSNDEPLGMTGSLFDFGDPVVDTPQQAEETPAPLDLPEPAAELAPAQDQPDELPASAPDDEAPIGNLLDGIIGQPAAVTNLRSALESPLPAYLFVGPAGSGLRNAACRFAGELLAARSPTPERERRLALAELHPDLVVFDRVGAAMTVEQARAAVREAALAPMTGDIKVIVLCDMDRSPLAAPSLLKTVEEPPPSTVMVLLADEVSRSMETLASRCVRVDFDALGESDLRELLVAEGIDQDRAVFSAVAAGGSIERARLLASDEDAASRIDTWRGLRGTLNGTASKAMVAVDTVVEAAEQASAPLEAKHADERTQADEQSELYGLTGSRKPLEERHRRELRRVRIDEFMMGFAVLSEQIRDDARTGSLRPEVAARQLVAIGEAAEAMRYNANQQLALSSMFIRIGRSDQ